MKKYAAVILAFSLTASLFGCGTENYPEKETKESSIQTTASEETSSETSAPSTEATSKETDFSNGDIDIDLSRVSFTMAQSQVNNFYMDPDPYLGKKIKIRGTFDMMEGEGRNYYTCNMTDKTACCQASLEFVWAGEHAYPEDYPAVGDVIIVTGVLESYMEGESLYIQLSDAELIRG